MKLFGPLRNSISGRARSCRKLLAVVLFWIASATFLSAQSPPRLVSIAVTPANSSIALGTTQQFTATGTYSDGSMQNITTTVVWSSDTTTVASISNAPPTQGLATGVGMGTATISATSGSISGSTMLTVTAAALVSIVVTPALQSIPLGTTQQFTATGTYTDGSMQNITTTVQWSSDTTTVASISNAPPTQGLATGVGMGTATIRATLNSISGSATLTVTPAVLVSIAVTPMTPSIALGTTQQFIATGTYTDGSMQNITTTVVWSSSSAAVATISNASPNNGLATSAGVGTTTITATSGAINGSTTLTVTAAVLISITISPTDPTIPLGTTQQFTATGTYSDGTTQDVTTAGHWTSSDRRVATISNSAPNQGLATSKGVGTTTIRITIGTVFATDTLTVNAAALKSIAISPLTPTIPLGKQQQFMATGTYTDGSTQDITTVVTWSSSSAAVAIISNTSGSNGLATSAGLGTTTITATLGLINGNTTLSVTAAVLTSIAVTPANPSIPLGTTQQFTATGTFSDLSTQDVTASVTWSSDTPTVASISTGGLATGVGVGVANITATSGSITGSATITVIPPLPPICSLKVSPTSGKVPLSVSMTANCSSPSGNAIAATIISLGDGFYQSGTTATHTFVNAGTFTVSVVASDTAGNSSAPASATVSASDTPSLFVGVSNGQIKQFDTTGNLIATLDTKQGGSITGMAFDAQDALYVTDFTADTVSKFDGSGNLVGSFGNGYNCQPESIVFDNAGNAYVGETGCSHALLKFDAYGNLAASTAVATEVEGSDWVDLASDQCTIFYTSQGTTIFRFNACTGQQLTPFATSLQTGLGLRILPDGGVLVADKQNIVRLDSGGRTITTYNANGESCWVSVTLDPDGTSFWAVDYCSSDIVQFDINSGNQLSKLNSGTPAQTVYGVAMRAPRPATAAGPLIATQQTLTVAAGQTASFDLAFSPVNGAVNQTFSFSCAHLPVGATCTFSPQTALVTSSGVTTHVTLNTSKASASLAPAAFALPRIYALWLFLPGMVLLTGIRRKSKGKGLRLLTLIVLVLALATLLACGGASSSSSNNSGSNPPPPPPTPTSTTPAGTYSIVIQASSNSLVSSTVVSLTVQ
jgi:Bacterial Ig-like domain (group 2)/PKD domain